jgi:lysyl-tRNA synthetase class 1
MFWADKLLEDVKGKQVINDSFTPSGIVHMGSLKGPVIHDVLYKILKQKNVDVEFKYGFDDMDVIDGLPAELQSSHEKYMGVPIYLAPAPSGDGNFADFFINKMKTLLKELDIEPNFYRTSEIYTSGEFDEALKIVLDNADRVRKVYSDIYKKEIANDWYPVQVKCSNCGKLGTTKVIGWDGKEVEFECMDHLVVWAKGCGTRSKASPFKGNGKMVWKVEWAAKWWKFGVTIEGAGKDHASAGGSYDVAMEIVKNVFDSHQPLKLAYEFFLSGGKKMSSSKGLGLTGESLLEATGPQRARFLMIKTSPNQAVEFTPQGTDTIPSLFDSYQEFAKSEEEDQRRVFELSQVAAEKVPDVRFSTIAQWVQMPGMEEEIKKNNADEWAKYARVWLERFAPEKDKFEVKKELPEEVGELSQEQKEYLGEIANVLGQNLSAEEFQTKIYDIAKEKGLKPQEAFSLIYISLIGKDHGPKAAWLILSLDKEFVRKRFSDIASS